MSGFLDRLVARHTAEPAIRPRARSRFEGGAAPGALPSESAPAAASRVTAGSPDASGTVPFDARPPRHAESFAPSATARPDSAGDDAESAARGAAGAPAVAPVTRSADAARLETSEPSSIARRAFGDARVSASTRRAAGAERSERAFREPDVVRVHIGRVEVRAVLPPADAPRAPKDPEPRPLSLERFLARKERP